MKKPYYFKFVVADQVEHKHNTYKQAVKTSQRVKEGVFLVIYLYSNKYKEPYDEVQIFDESEIEKAKEKLVRTIQKYL